MSPGGTKPRPVGIWNCNRAQIFQSTQTNRPFCGCAAPQFSRKRTHDYNGSRHRDRTHANFAQIGSPLRGRSCYEATPPGNGRHRCPIGATLRPSSRCWADRAALTLRPALHLLQRVAESMTPTQASPTARDLLSDMASSLCR